MWRSLRLPISNSKISSRCSNKKIQRFYTNSSSSSGSGGKLVIGLFACAGAGFAGAVVYGKYDPKFRKVLKENVPYIDYVYKYFDDDKQKPSTSTKDSSEKTRDISGSLLKKKLDREREKAPTFEVQKSSVEPKTTEIAPIPVNDSKNFDSNNLKKLESKPTEQKVIPTEKPEAQPASNEHLISDMMKKLIKSTEESKIAYEVAVKAVKQHTQTLYEALELPEGKDGDIVWSDVNKANTDRTKALKIAEEKAFQTRDIIEKLKANVMKMALNDAKNPIVKTAEDSVQKAAEQLQMSENEVILVETEAKTATEYQKLVSSSKEQFQKELKIVLPNYIYGDKDKLAEGDLNMLIAHAHRRIEQLQKQLAKQQVTEKVKIAEAVRLQKMKDDQFTESKIQVELERRHVDLQSAISDRVASLKENFEIELLQQLRRQAAAHADHLKEVLTVQEQELARKFSLELQEKLLHQKGVFISEVSGNLARLKGVFSFLKAKVEFDEASKKAQALWLACQAMNYKIADNNAGSPCPLGKDIAAVKIAADEDSEFVASVLAAIPLEAVDRGVYNSDVLKERFQDVKKVCRKVALIDENNDSLYRYFLSYLQSFLIADTISIPKEELEGKVAVDPSEWDTFDILGRITYCLKINDLEQALRYANQLKGEPRVVCKDWMKEARLLLETQLAVKALLAHAAAVGVQAYH